MTIALVLLAAALLMLSQIPAIHPVAAVAWALGFLTLIAAVLLAIRSRRQAHR